MTQPLRVGGYQGPASILSASLSSLCEQLQQHTVEFGPLEWTPNVTSAGESAASLFASVEAGERQLCYMASGYLSARVTALQVLDLPFTVSDRAHALTLLDGHAGELLRQAVEQDSGYKVLGFWDNGFRHLSNSQRPLRHPDDVQGMRVRTLDSALYRDSLNAMGFQAITSDVKELVQWVQTGHVQAQENPLTNYLGFELWRHHPHVSLSGHFWGVLLLLCPMRWYEGLSDVARDQLDGAAAMATRLQRELAAREDDRALTQLARLGVHVLLPKDMDLAAFRDRVRPIRQRIEGQLPPALIEAYLRV
ncbi:MAG: TRAP transporter substrate-binding protein [Betaproteobacteria bacterium]|nr:TRAP transporter substrate-binding protein [Betaproteobacteria bacterium]